MPVTSPVFRRLVARARKLGALPTAVVHPVDPESLRGAVLATRAGLIVPTLVGPPARIRHAAQQARLRIDGYAIVGTEHSHAAAAAAVALARQGRVACLVKGSLHTDELMEAALDGRTGLRTDRRASHAFILDVRSYPRPLLVTDAAINIAPDLDAKRDIVQNVIDLALALGIRAPRVALLSAVETVTMKIPSTVDAAALCKMADRGQITGGILDGPLAFDNAISEAARRAKGIASAVAGRPDVLVAPDLESGNILVKQLQYLAGAKAAGVVLGTRAPIALTSRADSAEARLVSCAIAAISRAAVDPVRRSGRGRRK